MPILLCYEVDAQVETVVLLYGRGVRGHPLCWHTVLSLTMSPLQGKEWRREVW